MAGSLAAVALAALPSIAADTPQAREIDPFLNDLQRRTFGYFWDLTNPRNGLTPDRGPGPAFCSVAATGFALTAYPIGVERRYVTRHQAARRVLATLRFLWTVPQGPARHGTIGHRGLFYHFLDMKTGHRFEQVELSTLDTALLMAGVLFCQSYFDSDHESERSLRALAERLYRRVQWNWAQPRPHAIALSWKPESGFHRYDYRGYNEAMILYLLALGSPSYPVATDVWPEYVSHYEWDAYYGQEHVNFGPLFGHQYSHVWIDFRDIRDDFMRRRGIDYFKNSRRATYAQRSYAMDNPQGWRGYGKHIWGLTACDGPANLARRIDGRHRTFHAYWARGASCLGIHDDGTIAPTAVASSFAFAPEIVLPTLAHMKNRFGADLFGRYGFLDAFNLTWTDTATPLIHGRVIPGRGWFDTEYVGINQGPILAMVENGRTGLVWRVMRKNRHVVRGLRRAGFSGGWLDDDNGPQVCRFWLEEIESTAGSANGDSRGAERRCGNARCGVGPAGEAARRHE